jgi:uracil-DNA glycosylase family 4
MGLMKDLHQRVHSPGGGRWREVAARAEELIQEHIRMICTEREFSAWSLEGMRRRRSVCELCPLHNDREKIVFGEGDPCPLVLIIGEAPGIEEDEKGRPFVGPAGKLLRAVVAKVGLNLQRDAYLTNAVMCRPPKGRLSTVDERQACSPRLKEQSQLLEPYVVLLLGSTALRMLVGAGRSPEVSAWRGRPIPKENWPDLSPAKLKVVFATYHPDDILRQNSHEAKRALMAKFVDDMRKLAQVAELLNRKVDRGL